MALDIKWRDGLGNPSEDDLTIDPGNSSGKTLEELTSVLNKGLDRTLNLTVSTPTGEKETLVVNQTGCRQAYVTKDGGRYVTKDTQVYGVLKADAPCECTDDCPDLRGGYLIYDYQRVASTESVTSDCSKPYVTHSTDKMKKLNEPVDHDYVMIDLHLTCDGTIAEDSCNEFYLGNGVRKAGDEKGYVFSAGMSNSGFKIFIGNDRVWNWGYPTTCYEEEELKVVFVRNADQDTLSYLSRKYDPLYIIRESGFDSDMWARVVSNIDLLLNSPDTDLILASRSETVREFKVTLFRNLTEDEVIEEAINGPGLRFKESSPIFADRTGVGERQHIDVSGGTFVSVSHDIDLIFDKSLTWKLDNLSPDDKDYKQPIFKIPIAGYVTEEELTSGTYVYMDMTYHNTEESSSYQLSYAPYSHVFNIFPETNPLFQIIGAYLTKVSGNPCPMVCMPLNMDLYESSIPNDVRDKGRILIRTYGEVKDYNISIRFGFDGDNLTVYSKIDTATSYTNITSSIDADNLALMRTHMMNILTGKDELYYRTTMDLDLNGSPYGFYMYEKDLAKGLKSMSIRVEKMS